LKIWLLRHAESEWNAAGRWQGHGDPGLSAGGREAARASAPSIAARVARAGREIRLFSSDLRRSVETAAFVAEAAGVAATAVRDLRELDVGAWTGLTRAAIEARDGALLAAFESEEADVRPGGGETRRELRQRVRAAALRLARENAGADLLLVVHLGVVRALLPGSEPDHLELLETDPEAIRRVQAFAALPR
jgi:broad specificity phosphatase PhoE